MGSNFYTDKDKKVVIEFCRAKIKDNGYVRLGWAVNETIKDKEFEGDGHRRAFLNSVSAMLVNTGEYVREKNEEILGDYDILLNPHFFLNKSVKNISRITAFIAGAARIVSGIGLYKQIGDNKNSPTLTLKKINTTLQQKQISTEIIEKRLKDIDSSIQNIIKIFPKK